jgi:uncharacterized membrane protein
MKSTLSIIGIALIIAGIVVFAYKGFPYTKQETVAQIGNLQVTADTKQTVDFPPIVGGVAVVVGIILIIVGRRRG